jgi:hypothetical protein
MPNLKYKPIVTYGEEDKQDPVFSKHFNMLKDNYKEVVAINLINQHGKGGS